VRERSLVAFTVLAQASAGTFAALLAARWAGAGASGWPAVEAGTAWAQVAVPAFMAAALVLSLLHLGNPSAAWRAGANAATSRLSREVLAAAAFLAASSAAAALAFAAPGATFWKGAVDGAGLLAGLLLLGSMSGAYRLRTVPAWDRWTTPAAFAGTAVLLGALGAGTALALSPGVAPLPDETPGYLALASLAALFGQTLVLMGWLAALGKGSPAEREALVRVLRRRGLLVGRLVLGGAAALASISVLFVDHVEIPLAAALLLAAGAEVSGRALFYEAGVRTGL
jgi:anaerobic dimethyl sulfoxide reductase subunit C (anchor subunit)